MLACGGEKNPLCGPHSPRQGTKIMAVGDRAGLPVSVSIASASPHEITLVDAALDALLTDGTPIRLIGDRAYDSDPLDARLRQTWRVEMIAPHRARRRPPTQDRRVLPVVTTTVVDVNTNALAIGTPFYNLQEKHQRTIKGVTYCAQSFVITLVPLVDAHEGTTPGAFPNSHAGIFRHHVDSVAGPRFEPIAGPGTSLSFDAVRNAIFTEAADDDSAMDHDSRNNLNNVTVPCQFHFFTQ